MFPLYGQRPNELNHPRPYFEISLVNEKLLMNAINVTSECVPKDIKGSGAYTEPGQPAPLWQAGSYGSALSTLRTKLVAAMEGQFRRDKELLQSLVSVVAVPVRHASQQLSWLRMIGLEARLLSKLFGHLHAWHAKYPKDSGNKYCLELNTHSAGVYGIAFELNTVLHHQWKYDTNGVQKLAKTLTCFRSTTSDQALRVCFAIFGI